MYPMTENLVLSDVVTEIVVTTTSEINYTTERLQHNATGVSFIPACKFETNGTFDSFYFYETEQFAVLWFLFIVIVLGNTAVLVTLFLNKSRKSRMNFFIKQLAIADLSVGLLQVLTDIVQRITINWLAGNVLCKIIRFLEVTVMYSSTYMLVALSIDRYDAITHPMNFSGCWKRARRLVAAAWGMSAILASPMFYLYHECVLQEMLQCWIELGSDLGWQLYMSWVSITIFIIPAFIIAACYVTIIRTIWSKGSMLGPVGGKYRFRNGSADLASRRASSRGIIPKAKVKTVKMTIVIVVVFVMCSTPYHIYNLLEVFKTFRKTQTSTAISSFVQSLVPLNSAANPLIYCIFSTHFVRTLKRLPPFRWLFSSGSCCSSAENSVDRSSCRQAVNGARLRNQHSSDSMRTLTTSLTVSTRRPTTVIRTSRVIV